MLEVKDLRVKFHSREGYAVDGISLTVPEGEILGLVGESGSGKSVTAMSVVGLLQQAQCTLEGSVLLDGEEILYASPERMRQIRGKEIGFVFQEPMTAMDPLMKIGLQVEEALFLHTDLPRKERKARVLEAMSLVELPSPAVLYEKYPHQLSGGMLQRAMIAAAIVTCPRLLLLDEPTTALDVTVQEQIITLLKKLNRELGMSMLFISHDLSVVKKLCPKAAVMCQGKIVEEGKTEELFRHPRQEYTRRLIAAIPTRPDRREGETP